MSTLFNQQTEVHVQLGNGAPAFLPTAIGQHYIDIANRRVYQSVGINSVEDWALPLATLTDIQELDLVGDKADVGLGNVEDYAVANQAEAELGQANDRYMTPLRVTQLLNALFMPVLDTFMARRDNPHQVTAEQVGALTSEATQLLLDEKLAEGDLAGLLQAFWAEKVGSAPETLDTIQEISTALQNNPDVITVLQQLVNDNAAAIGALETRVDGVDTTITQVQTDLSAEVTARTTADQALDAKINEVDSRLDDSKVDVGGDISTNTVTQGEGEEAQQVALSVLIAQLQAGIPEAGDASDLEALQTALDAFIAAKATGEEAIAGTDDTKYITALALKAALDVLDLSGKLDVDAQAADSAKLGGLSLEEVIAQITNVSGAELAIKIDITEGYAPGSNITLDRVFFYDAVGDEIEHLVDLSGIQVVDGYVNYINGKVELSDLNSQSSVVFTGFGEVPKEVTHVNLEFTCLYDAKGTLSVVNAADASEVFGTYAFDAAGAQLVRDPWADGFDFPFTMPSAGGLSLAALQAAIAELESRAVLDGEHVSTNLVTFDHLDLVLEKQIQDFDTELLTREVGQELWSVVRNAGVDTFSMSTDGVTFNPLPPLEMFPEAQRPVYEALFTELSAWVDDEAAADGTVFYAVTEDRTVLGPVSKVDVLLKDVLSVLETKVAQLFKDVSRNHQNSMASDNQIREDLGNLQGKVYDLNRGVVETLAGAPEMAVKFDFSAAWTQGALHQIEALEFLGGDDSVIGTVALDQVKLHSGIMGYENGVINLSGLGYFQPRQTVLNIGDIPAGAVKLRVVGTGLENGVGVLEVGSIGAKGVVYGSLAIVENLDVANSLIVPFAVPKLSDINVLKDQAADVAGRVTDLETGKLDATAQAVDSALLEGRSVADLTASYVEATSGVVTDKFMTPGTAKEAFDARWAEKVGAAPETLDTIEEIALALRNNPDSLAAVETVAKQYTDEEVLAAIQQISGENMEAGTTLASLYAQVVALQDTKLDKTATAVNSEKLGGKSLMEVIDLAIQPGRLFYPVVHVNGSLAEDNYVMPTPADVWAQVKTNAVLEQVDTIYAVGVKRLLPGNLLALTSQEGMTLHGAVSEAQEGPVYVIMRAGIEDTEWTVITDPLLGCVARLSKHCVVVGDNTERFVPGQTLFYNGFEALSENVYYDWTLMADKEWEVATFTGTDLAINSSRYHRSEIRIQSTGPVTVTFDVPTDLPYEMEVRFVNQTGVEVTFAGGNVVSVPRMQQYTLTKVNGVVRAVRYTNTSVALAGDLDEAFFVNPDYSAPQP